MTDRNNGNKPCTDAFKGSYIEYATLHVPMAYVDAYKSTDPWSDFKNIVAIPEKCATPTIAFIDGELVFSCETEDVEYHWEVTVEGGSSKGNGSKAGLTSVYKVSVYATKDGWEDSDVATKVLTAVTGGEVCDVNKDGLVDVADIATIIDKMASTSRQE